MGTHSKTQIQWKCKVHTQNHEILESEPLGGRILLPLFVVSMVSLASTSATGASTSATGADESKTTKSNKWEAEMCIEIVRYLLLQGYAHSQITVLTPYLGQVLLLLNTMKSKMQDTSAYISDLDQEEILGNMEDEDDAAALNDMSTNKRVRCSSIDNFQGDI